MSSARILVDGVESAQVAVTDRGLMYGDGLFETIAVHGGLPCLWDAHMRRLRMGADRLSIPCPSESLLWRECRTVIGRASRCVVKLVITRGSGGRGYGPPVRIRPTRIFSCHPWTEHPAEWFRSGVSVAICRTRLAEQPILAGIKHLNRLEQVLARSEWNDPACAEGVMCDRHGRVICGTTSNLFLFDKDGLVTPRLDSCGIAGTVRGLILRTAALFGISAAEGELYVPDLFRADGLFLTNALIGAWPVRHLGERRYDVHRLPLELLDWIRVAAHQLDPEYRDPCAPC